MKICIIDADLIGRKKHRFPNLACEKISAFWKDKGAQVTLKLDYDNLELYDRVYISKVFTDTPVPQWIQDGVNMDLVKVNLPSNIYVGGTGFFFDKAPNLPDEIEHHMPDYHLYDEWIFNEVNKAEVKAKSENREFNKSTYMVQFREYLEYSIGFMTRGCFRKCAFCVNQKYDRVFNHSPLEEFYDKSRKKICLLDDNFFGCPSWKEMLQQLIDTGKSFKFKQGMDERLLTQEKADMLFSYKYDGDYTFAFDNISDYDLIHRKLKMIRSSTKENKNSIKFYVLVGFESTDHKDIENCFKRIELLFMYQCLPYVMRYQNKNEIPWKKSKYRSLYVTIARWANQPSIVKKMSFRQFCEANQALHKTKESLCSSMKSMIEFEKEFPEIAQKYFDMRFEDMRCY
ncbi:hypothetical protein [uncultured Thomasclavelia sp.]|uniref:hypothetical protein n=1 Tax=uncultured Thomasclavelia sp. TaxID=3025759 RepID=UPI002637BA1E|nr:hypothetical protein [uncultured Thomasclavelia sp.]